MPIDGALRSVGKDLAQFTGAFVMIGSLCLGSPFLLNILLRKTTNSRKKMNLKKHVEKKHDEIK